MTSTNDNAISQSSTNTDPINPPQPRRTVTFNPQATVKDPRQPASTATDLRSSSSGAFTHTLETSRNVTSTQPMLSNLNSKLRRRNSHGSPLTTPSSTPASKIGPQRTTKNAQKLKLLPNPDLGDEGPDEESGRDVYSQFTRIKDPTARRDAARLGKADREKLPRVTAYCTANHYRLEGLMKFLKSRAKTRGAAPKQFDECIYSPYRYPTTKPEKRRPPLLDRRSEVLIDIQEEEEDENFPFPPPQQERRYSDSAIEVNDHSNQRREELIDLHTEAGDTALENGQASIADHIHEEPPLPEVTNPDFDTQVHTPEVFLFDYGTVVIWGMTLQQEQRFLKDISKFENERLSEDDVQSEQFNFYYTREYQARIYNDFISLREKKNYMTKLAISHALSQSVKVRILHLFIPLILYTIAPCPLYILPASIVHSISLPFLSLLYLIIVPL